MTIIYRIFFVLILIIPSTFCFAAKNKPLEQLIDDYWAFKTSNPFAKHIYYKGPIPTQFNDISESKLATDQKKIAAFLKRSKTVPMKELNESEQINLSLLRLRLEHEISHFGHKQHYITFNTDTFFFQLYYRINSLNITTKQDYQNYLELLKDIPNYLQQHTNLMRKGIAAGLTQPKFMAPIAEQAINAIIVSDIEASSFWQPLTKIPNTINAKTSKRLKAEAKAIIQNTIIPAYKTLKTFFMTEYFPRAKTSLAASDWPNGKAIYQFWINHYTTLDLTANEIHDIGIAEVKRIKNEMMAIIKQVNYQKGFKAFLQFLRTDPQFYAKTPEELLMKASFYAKEMDGELPKLFYKLPRLPYTVKPVPASIAPNYTTGRYSRGNLALKRPGVYLVNTYALEQRPLYELQALTYHEAVPGHHLQIALSQELEGIPAFRRNMYLSAFGEGWALYSEQLGKELGLYSDPYSDFGRLSYEMWRALRLVVDTGIHAKNWSRDRAVQFMVDNSALSKANIETEVNRYITWPAQALSYKLGQIKIIELRKLAQQQLQEKFDIRDFHDKILAQGALPLYMLEARIKNYIKSQLN